MATTSYADAAMSVSAIGARTDSSGAAVADISAEELRIPLAAWSEGYLTTNAFKVQAQSSPDMTVKVGSGTAKADLYVVGGDAAGQGNYAARLDVTSVTVTIGAADASQARTDEVWLVVHDTAYDASSRALPRIAYRKGDLGGGNPGPDSAWKASALLARVTVTAAATTITSGNISDQRVAAGLTVPGAAAVGSLTVAGSSIASQLSGLASSTHGHDPLAANMTGTSGTRGFARFWSDIGEAIGTNTMQKVGFYIANPGDSLVTWASEIPGDSFTLNASGIWAITATWRYPGVSQAGERYGELRNGSTVLTADGAPSAANQPFTINLSWTGYLASGSVVRAYSIQQSGVTLFIDGTAEKWRNINFALVRRTT